MEGYTQQEKPTTVVKRGCW